MQVKEVMLCPVVVVREDATLEEAARLMLDRAIGCLPVVGGAGRLCGIITRSDFVGKDCGCSTVFQAPSLLGHWLQHQGEVQRHVDARTRLVRENMTANVRTVAEDDPLEKAVRLMLERRIKRLPVVRRQVPVGILSRHDLLRILWREQLAHALGGRT